MILISFFIEGINMIHIGDTAPDFRLKNHEEKEITLKDFKNQWSVVYFYPKDNTPGCTLEAKNFSERINDFKKENVNIIGISPDSTSSHNRFKEKHNLSFSLLSDEQHSTLKDYDVWKTKKMHGKEYKGVERTTFLINPEGKIEHIWSKVKVPNHVDDVLKKIKEVKE